MMNWCLSITSNCFYTKLCLFYGSHWSSSSSSNSVFIPLCWLLQSCWYYSLLRVDKLLSIKDRSFGRVLRILSLAVLWWRWCRVHVLQLICLILDVCSVSCNSLHFIIINLFVSTTHIHLVIRGKLLLKLLAMNKFPGYLTNVLVCI